MYSSGPIKRVGRRRSAEEADKENQETIMLGSIARWGHNMLLAGLALMTLVLFFALLR
jgi:hypothetical protein